MIHAFARILGTDDRLRILRMMELVAAFENSTLWYKIPTSRTVDSEPTEDQLYRHVIPLGGWIRRETETRTTVPDFGEIEVDDKFLTLPATAENIRRAFEEHYPEISQHGALVIPRTFENSVDVDRSDSIDVTFEYSRIDFFDRRLLDHILVVD